MRSLSDPKFRKILGNAPAYIGTLLATEWIKCVVDEDGPAIAWTEWDKETKRFEVHFHESVAAMSPEAIRTLWRHEVGHIVFGHFGKELCEPTNPMRSIQEVLVASDIQVNTYLGVTPQVEEIGKTALAMYPSKAEGDEKTEPKGFIDPTEWLPKIGLCMSEYPYDVIHTYLHDWIDQQEEEDGGGNGQGDGMGTQYVCGGIQGVEEGDGNSADINAAVVTAISGAGTEDEAGEAWGSDPGHMRMKFKPSELPVWLNAVENWARSVVEVVLDERRKHARPNEIYKSVGVHIPTTRPSWYYKPSQVCFLVDTSGSMVGELKYVNPVIEYLARHNIETRLITGDTYVTFDDVVTSIPEIKGGGGTDITPLFNRAKKYEPESIIAFTDGYVPAWPKDDGTPTLWVGTKEKPPYGTIA